jgi:D-tagatose-1,6-bisphosphate aldolase subunit GatZ/KbaZ
MPLSLLSQYLPRQYESVRRGALRNGARELALAAVEGVLLQYSRACSSAPEHRLDLQ